MFLAKEYSFSEATKLMKLANLRIKITQNPFYASGADRIRAKM